MAKKLKFKRNFEQGDKGKCNAKLSTEQTREIWNDDEIKYTDEELLKIREWFYCLSEVVLNIYYHPRYEKLINEYKTWKNERKESDIVCEGEYRRAS